MRYVILDTDRLPAYLQLYRQLREDIVNELYSYGSRLPSKRTLADEAGVSTITAEHAYALLCDEGYAESRERSGFFVSFRASDGFAGAGLSPHSQRVSSPASATYGCAVENSSAPSLRANSFSETSDKLRITATIGTSNGSIGTSNGSIGTSNGSIGTSNGSIGTSNESIGTANPRYDPYVAPTDGMLEHPRIHDTSDNKNRHSRMEGGHSGVKTGLSYPALAKSMRRVMSDYAEELLVRSPNSGRHELRTAIGQYLARSRGIHVNPEQIIIGSGSEYLYGLIVELLGRGKTFAIEAPSYQKIEQVYRASDARYEMLPLGKDGIESAALWTSHADVLHISPYRSFPSGVTATASKRHEYLRWAEGGDRINSGRNGMHPNDSNHTNGSYNDDYCGRYIIEDDFESEFSVLNKPEETLFAIALSENVIYMNTFTRTISPSLRVGYMVLPPRLVPVFEEKLGFYSCTVPTFEQLVLTDLITSGDFERHINRVRRLMRRSALDGK